MVTAGAYGGLLGYQRTLTGAAMLDGMIGVLLGLYVCSHPAANAIDALFYGRSASARITWSGAAWMALNLLAMLVGWLTIVTGVTRLVG
jgi:hypothetical protein